MMHLGPALDGIACGSIYLIYTHLLCLACERGKKKFRSMYLIST